MYSKDYKEYIIHIKSEYRKIGYVISPAFNNDKIFFNRKGFQHLLYKNGDRRSKKDQMSRLVLISHAVSIVASVKVYDEYRVNNGVKFWSLKKQLQSKIITVIICQVNDSVKYFLSVMSKNMPK